MAAIVLTDDLFKKRVQERIQAIKLQLKTAKGHNRKLIAERLKIYEEIARKEGI